MTELWRLNASEISSRVAARELSASEVTEQSLQRLQAVNPLINAVVQELPEQALAEARAVDERIAAGESAGPLAGVPVTIKVNIDQQGLANTNGIRIQQDNIAEHDSPVVTNLRNAGAIIIGRTNTPAFSMRWVTRNSLHGHTVPTSPDRYAIPPTPAVCTGCGPASGASLRSTCRCPIATSARS